MSKQIDIFYYLVLKYIDYWQNVNYNYLIFNKIKFGPLVTVIKNIISVRIIFIFVGKS